MTLRRDAAPDERAASSLVGTVLLVALVLIVGTILAVYAFGFLEAVDDSPPQARFTGEFSSAGNLTVTHTNGDTISAADVLVTVEDASGYSELGTWASLAGSSADISSGSSVTLSGFNGDETVYLIWEPASADRSVILRQFQTRSVSGPVSSAAVAESSGGFASQEGAFGNRSWQSLARIGGGGWELSTSQDDQPDNANQQAEYTWQNGQSVPFTLAFNQSGNGEATLTVDGQTASADTTGYPTTGDTIGMTLRVVDNSTTVSVSDLRLNGLRLSQDSASTGGNGFANLLIDDDSIGDGFVLTGTVTMDWPGSKPSNSQMQLNFEIEEQGTGSS